MYLKVSVGVREQPVRYRAYLNRLELTSGCYGPLQYISLSKVEARKREGSLPRGCARKKRFDLPVTRRWTFLQFHSQSSSSSEAFADLLLFDWSSRCCVFREPCICLALGPIDCGCSRTRSVAVVVGLPWLRLVGERMWRV